jgi:hypothetical protein
MTPRSCRRRSTQSTRYDPIGHVDELAFAGDASDPDVNYTYALDNDPLIRDTEGKTPRLFFYWGTTGGRGCRGRRSSGRYVHLSRCSDMRSSPHRGNVGREPCRRIRVRPSH